jgi:hypothetical protein
MDALNPSVVEDPSQDPGVKYDVNVASRDVPALMQSAATSTDPIYKEHAAKAANVIQMGQLDFANKIGPIEAAGGPQTPEGRLKAVETWKSVSDDKQWGTALIRYLLGDKQGASDLITGGSIKQTQKYDLQGNPLLVTTNALGQIVNVNDPTSGKEVLPSEYGARGVGISTYGETLGSTVAQTETKARAATLAENEKRNSAWGAKLPALNAYWTELDNNLKFIQSKKNDIPASTYADLMGFVTKSQSAGATKSKSESLLGQYTKGAGSAAGTQISSDVAAQMGFKGGPLTADGKGGFVDNNGTHHSAGELSQNINSSSSSEESQQAFQKTLASVMEGLRLTNMDDVTQNIFKRTMEVAHLAGRDVADLTASFGSPLFLSMPSAFGVTDKYAQGRAQALQGQFNAEAMGAFQIYSDAIKSTLPKGQVPAQNEIEQNFTKTKAYKDLKNKYSDKIEAALQEKSAAPNPPKEKPAEAPTATKPADAKAATSVPKGYTKIGKTPDGRTVFRTPEGKQVVESK